MKKFILAGVAAVVACGSAQAANIKLIDLGGVTGSASEQGFKIAAAYWGNVLTNDVTVNLGVKYAALGEGVIGSTGSTKYNAAIQDVEALMSANGNSALDKALVKPTIIGSTSGLSGFAGSVGTIGMVTPGYKTAATKIGIDTTTAVYDADNTRNNAIVSGTAANLKALGYTGFTNATDAQVTFSTAFNFDFDPTDGITAGYMDFIGVAIHEIGHALGFTSGVDTYDAYGPKGPNAASAGAVNANGSTVGNVLDLFRYSDTNAALAGTGAKAVLDWTVGTPSYFSIDGGNSQLFGNSLFSTGAYNGDGRQASHFKDAVGCSGQIGIMDPTFCYGQMGDITALDLAAFDAIGWNTSVDVLANSGYHITTADIYSQFATGVPEAATWAQLVLGFGLLGGAVRLRGRGNAPVRA